MKLPHAYQIGKNPDVSWLMSTDPHLPPLTKLTHAYPVSKTTICSLSHELCPPPSYPQFCGKLSHPPTKLTCASPASLTTMCFFSHVSPTPSPSFPQLCVNIPPPPPPTKLTRAYPARLRPLCVSFHLSCPPPPPPNPLPVSPQPCVINLSK